MRHWQQTDPERFQAIEDPQEFFTTLGAEVEQEIETLAAALAGPDRLGESYLEKVGRLNMAKFNAESDILRERVLIAGPDEDRQEPVDGPERGHVRAADAAQPDERRGDRSAGRPSVRRLARLTFTPGSGEDQLPPSGAEGARSREPRRTEGPDRTGGPRPTRPASEQELRVLGRWSGWGACPDMFDEDKRDWQPERDELRALLAQRESHANPLGAVVGGGCLQRGAAHDAQRALHPPAARPGDVGDGGHLGFTGGNVLRAGLWAWDVHRPGTRWHGDDRG